MNIFRKIKDLFSISCPQCCGKLHWDNGWGRFDCDNCLWHEGHIPDPNYNLAKEEISSGVADDAIVKDSEVK